MNLKSTIARMNLWPEEKQKMFLKAVHNFMRLTGYSLEESLNKMMELMP
jgi:hypothetical protein